MARIAGGACAAIRYSSVVRITAPVRVQGGSITIQIHQAVVSGQAVQYSVVNALVMAGPGFQKLLPHRAGNYKLAVCRECGLGIVSAREDEAVHLFLSTVRPYTGHHIHCMATDQPRAQFNPEIIDYIYDAFDPEGKVA